jgi:hypothetical protein
MPSYRLARPPLTMRAASGARWGSPQPRQRRGGEAETSGHTADDARRERRGEEAETSGQAADDARRRTPGEVATWGLGCGIALA